MDQGSAGQLKASSSEGATIPVSGDGLGATTRGHNVNVMRVLLTGSSGGVGRAARPVLEAARGVRPLDLADGADLGTSLPCVTLWKVATRSFTPGRHDTAGTPTDIVATNVLGRWYVLWRRRGLGSSGLFISLRLRSSASQRCEGEPAYLPADDDHPQSFASLWHVQAPCRGDVRGLDR